MSLRLLILAALLCLQAGSALAAPSMPAYTGDFFVAPNAATLPTAPGTLLRYQPLTDVTSTVPSTVYRVMYVSTMTRTQAGVTTSFRIPATGLVSIPVAAAPAGGFKTLVFAHGTLGVIPKCGPSRTGPRWPSWLESLSVKTVAPDYPGLGVDAGLRSVDANHRSAHPWYAGLVYQRPFDETTHPYISLQGEARTTIDLVRAARQLEAVLAGLAGPSGNIGTNREFAVIGASQGGHAALGTGELMASGYAPDLTLRALVAGAPASEFMDTMSIDPGLRDGFFPLTIVGGSIEFPELRPANWMTLVGQANYQRTSESVCADGIDWFISNVGFNSYPFTVAQAQLNTIPGYAAFAAANSPGYRPIRVPVLVGEVDEDPLIFPVRVDTMVSRLRQQLGADVTYCRYASNGASDYITKMWNHFNVTERLRDGAGQRCTNQAGVNPGNVTASSFLSNAGFAL